MRILHINRNYLTSVMHQEMIEALDCLGCKNTVFVPTTKDAVARIAPNANVQVSACFCHFDRFFFHLKQLKILNALKKSNKKERFDIIHAYTLFTDGGVAYKRHMKTGEPYVVAVRNTDVNAFFRLMPHLRRYGLQIMLHASAIFFLSENYREMVFSHYIPRRFRDVLYAKTYIIPNGLPKFWLENVYSRNDDCIQQPIRVLYAGRIDRNKNISTTQAAISLLRDEGCDVRLTVIGEVEDMKEYKKIAADPFTTCLPAIPRLQLLPIYREHQLFVMPSFTETFGLVYLEALTQGLPVVYTKGQGFDGQFPEGTVGYHVDPRSPKSIAEAIMRILEHYKVITENAAQAVSRYAWSEIARRYDDIYQNIKKG